MHVLLFGLVLCLLAYPAAALDEEHVYDRMIALYAQDKGCDDAPEYPAWERRKVTNPGDGYVLRYSRFGCSLGARGALVPFPGRGEGSFEYYETAMDFIARGLSPVHVVDHRGQGLSPRLLTDPHKGHVDRFEDYIDDALSFVGAVEQDLTGLGAGENVPLFLTSNSMGGAIAIGLFQRLGPDNPFRAAAFLGSMIQVNYHSFTGTPATWLNLRLYSETGALLQARWRCSVATLWNPQRCEDYAAASAAEGYRPGSRRFAEESQALMTHSAARYELRTYMMDSFDWSEIAATEYAASEHWPGPQLGGATNGWVREAARFNREMRQPENLRKMVHVPVMLLTGSEDLRAYRPYARWRHDPPDLSRHIAFCDALNVESMDRTGRYVCQFVPLNGGYHELYKERDTERQNALDTVDWFFQTHPAAPAEAN
ncbi:serine aminopeptidase domain-containing protein [Aestuariicoccus sp. MJ-SS9]|uniref:serine aminopeptidase domain-containing protein n=1 Tax=Aestuariicoccus sp. MJ-SS9 TaxID=3079855 RepID=UPI002911BED3|nr:alpha/beta hydrolase [Aestuariicoccus sp. MJ-SS9]MDU8910214.1 alpha/beta hydrolase [Aestuariicoccus sp. MJ-SS9]